MVFKERPLDWTEDQKKGYSCSLMSVSPPPTSNLGNFPCPVFQSSSLTFSSLNSRGLMSNWYYIQHILHHHNFDFFAISEHWLHDYNLNVIHQLSGGYKFVAVPSPKEEDSVYCVPRLIRGHGGVALGWRSELDAFVSRIPFVSSSRIIGIQFSLPQYTLYIISVYLPSRSGCTDVFKESLDQLEAILMLLPPGAEIIIMGDLNADLGQLGGPMSCTQMNEQGSVLHRYISRWNFASTHLQLQSDGPSYTYESEAHSILSTLDHILCPVHMLPKFQSAYTIVDEPLNTSDHIPVIAVLHHDFFFTYSSYSYKFLSGHPQEMV